MPYRGEGGRGGELSADRCVRDIGLFLDAMGGSEGWNVSPPQLPPGEKSWESTVLYRQPNKLYIYIYIERERGYTRPFESLYESLLESCMGICVFC